MATTAKTKPSGHSAAPRERGSRYDLRKRERFIELRAQGLSYDRIARIIHVSKPTLLKWNEAFRDRIAALRSLRLDELHDKFQLLAESRLESYGREIQKIHRELKNRDYSDVATERLPDILVKLYTSLRKEDLFAKEQAAVERPPETWLDLMKRAYMNQELTET